MPSSQHPRPSPDPRWVRRHPIATGVCVLAAGLFALTIVAPGDEARSGIVASVLILAVPLALIVWLATWLIDRRHDRRARRADEADAGASGLANVYPPPAAFPSSTPRSGIFPPPGSRAAARQAAVTPPGGPAGLRSSDPAVPGLAADQPVSDDPAFDPPASAPGRWRPVTLGGLLERSPAELEGLCVRLLTGLGYSDVRRTGEAGDLGADLVAKDPQGRPVYVRVRRDEPGDAVDASTVRSLVEMITARHHADRGIVMTTGVFSSPAVRLAEEHDVLLVDGDGIVTLLNLTGVR